MKRSHIINLFIFIALISWATCRYANKSYNVTERKFALDTIIEISIETKSKDYQSIIDSAFVLIEKLDSTYSYYQNNSKVWKMNHQGGDIILDNNLLAMYNLASEYFQLSSNRYNIAIGQLTDIWDFKQQIIPDNKIIEQAKTMIDFRALNVDGNVLTKPETIKLNFGSIAKGMIVDRVIEYFINNKIESGLINAGGDIRIFGKSKPIQIGIQHPRETRNEIIEILSITNKAVVTSGDYERYFIVNGQRYHHILDPLTGYPANNCVSVTVIASSAMEADALSTTLFLLDPESGLKIVNSLENTEAIIFYSDKEIIKSVKSPGFDKYIQK